MKKKAIEAIPYITVPKPMTKQKVGYICAVQTLEIAGEPHILLEVYENKKDSLSVPKIRYAATLGDWAVYNPAEGIWSTHSITYNQWHSNALCWTDTKYKSYQEEQKDNVLLPESLEQIKAFFRVTEESWRDQSWWEYFTANEQHISNARRSGRYERRKLRLEERIAHTPPLPTERILEYASTIRAISYHFLYYKKGRYKATVCCSACGNVREAYWKDGIGYTSAYASHIQEPIEGHAGECPTCGKTGIFKAQGHAGRERINKTHVFLIEKYKAKGAVIRYIQVEKGYFLEEIPGTKHAEMIGAKETLQGVEIARTYIEPGKQPQTDYQKHDCYTGKDFWDDCNLYGLSNILIQPARILPESFENLKGTILEYSGLEAYYKREVITGTPVNASSYIDCYLRTPQLEYLVKLKLYAIAEELIRYRYGIVVDTTAKTLDSFLGIRKEHLNLLMKTRGNLEVLKLLQQEKRMDAHFTDEEIENLALLRIHSIHEIPKEMTIRKFLNRVAKYAGCDYREVCSAATGRLQSIAGEYLDYLDMRAKLGYDMTNTVYLYPRNLADAHSRMVAESNAREADKRKQEAEERYPDIAKKYKSLCKTFRYVDDTYIICPARSASEIIDEGRILHHCVGGDTYLDRHNKQKSIILFLRFKETPKAPYVTVEIDPTFQIKQWYGAHDRKPDEKNLQKWLNRYTTMLKCRKEGIQEESMAAVQTPILAMA